MNYPEAKIDAIVASVRDKERLNEIFEDPLTIQETILTVSE